MDYSDRSTSVEGAEAKSSGGSATWHGKSWQVTSRDRKSQAAAGANTSQTITQSIYMHNADHNSEPIMA